MAHFKKHEYFPIVAEIIDENLTQKEVIHRDEIVEVLFQKEHTKIIQIAKTANKKPLFIAQNMVDWFSAELSKNSDIVKEWQNKYVRNKVKINGRKITSYALTLNSQQDEIIEDSGLYLEGSVKKITVNAYERNPKARQVCLDHYGYSCQCCGFNFEKTYGEIGKNFIHVHHITPLSEMKAEYKLNPIQDLIPVCANCHAMIHRKNPPLSIFELSSIFK